MKIHRGFNLDLEKVKELSNKEKEKLSPGVGKKLVKELKAKGYNVLECCGFIMGIPRSLIVSGKTNSPIKQDFGEIAAKLGLNCFKSGESYTEAK